MSYIPIEVTIKQLENFKLELETLYDAKFLEYNSTTGEESEKINLELIKISDDRDAVVEGIKVYKRMLEEDSKVFSKLIEVVTRRKP